MNTAGIEPTTSRQLRADRLGFSVFLKLAMDQRRQIRAAHGIFAASSII